MKLNSKFIIDYLDFKFILILKRQDIFFFNKPQSVW